MATATVGSRCNLVQQQDVTAALSQCSFALLSVEQRTLHPIVGSAEKTSIHVTKQAYMPLYLLLSISEVTGAVKTILRAQQGKLPDTCRACLGVITASRIESCSYFWSQTCDQCMSD